MGRREPEGSPRLGRFPQEEVLDHDVGVMQALVVEVACAATARQACSKGRIGLEVMHLHHRHQLGIEAFLDDSLDVQ